MSAPSAEVVNAFVSALVRVLRASVGEHASLAALTTARTLDPAPSIAVAIELRGSLRGPVTWVFSPELAAKITAKMMMDDDAPSELIADAVAELSNIVAGNATGPLSDAGYDVEIAPPVIYAIDRGRELPAETLVATLSSASGTVRVFVGVEVA